MEPTQRYENTSPLLAALAAVFLFLLVACVAVWAAKHPPSVVSPAAPVALLPLPPLPEEPSPCGYQPQTYRMRDYLVEDSHGSHLVGAPGPMTGNLHIYRH